MYGAVLGGDAVAWLSGVGVGTWGTVLVYLLLLWGVC
jgi:hypothetical protein